MDSEAAVDDSATNLSPADKVNAGANEMMRLRALQPSRMAAVTFGKSLVPAHEPSPPAVVCDDAEDVEFTESACRRIDDMIERLGSVRRSNESGRGSSPPSTQLRANAMLAKRQHGTFRSKTLAALTAMRLKGGAKPSPSPSPPAEALPVAASPPSPRAARPTPNAQVTTGLTERHPVMLALDVCFLCATMVSCIVASFVLHPRTSESFGDFFSDPRVLVPYNAVLEAFNVVWFTSRFFLAVRTAEWEVLVDLPSIRRYYVRTWCFYDLMYCLPVGTILAYAAPNSVHWFMLRNLLRLPRLFVLSRSSHPLQGKRLWYQFLSFCMWTLLGLHVAACIFWALEKTYEYNQSAYWAIATFAVIGYGDVVPLTFNGRVFCVVAMMLGVMALASINAFATLLLRNRDQRQVDEDLKKELMHSMLDYYEVPWSVQLEVIGSVPSMIKKDHEEAFKSVAAKLPSYLAARVDEFVRVKLLTNIPLFQHISHDFAALHALSLALRQKFFPARGTIFEQGSIDDDTMHVVVQGTVEVIVLLDEDDADGDGNFEAVVTRVVQRDMQFGEAALVLSGPRRASAQAVTVVETLALSRPDFDALQQGHAAAYGILHAELTASALAELSHFDELLRAAGH